MVRNNDLKEIVIKNYTCNYFDDMININNLDDILLNEKSYNNISIYHATYKTSYDQKPFCIILYKVDGYIRKHDSTKYLALFRSDEKYERIFDRIRYLIIWKSNISDVYFHKYTNIKTYSNNNLPLGKKLNIHVVILTKSGFNENNISIACVLEKRLHD